MYGGISGKTWINNYIQRCYNSGDIFGDDVIGGIIGDMSGSNNYMSEISNCYNIGAIYSNRIVGGIAGNIYGNNNSIKNCYNIGNLEAKGSKNFRGSIVGYKSGGIIQKCYYSNTSEIKAIENEDDETNDVYGLEKEFMKTEEFVNLLNAGNENDVWKLVEADYKYPVLSWQTISPEFSEEGVSLTGIAIAKAPDDVDYIEGQNFDPTGMVVTAAYNDGTTKEVTNYTVTDGENLTVGKTSVTISYTEDGVTKTTTQSITVTEKLEIDLGTYEEQQEETGKYITKIAPETTIEEVLENIETNGTIEIYKGTEKITNTETNIGTGMTVRITLNDEQLEYTIVVKGDINGDGKAKLSDLSKLKLSVIGTTQLEGAYKEAADINGDGNVKLSDLSKMKLYLVGTGSL